MDREESIRIHLDWWEKCMTCHYWYGDRLKTGLADGECMNDASTLYKKPTTCQGHCPKWDTFDPDVAFGLLELWEQGIKTSHMDLAHIERILSCS